MSAYLDIRVKWSYFGAMNKAGVSMLEMMDPNYFVRLYIDSTTEYTKLHASKKVHHIPVEPGAHTIIITRREIGKTTFSDVCNVAFGGVLGAALGSSGMAAMGTDFAQKFISENHLEGARVLEFHEGQTIACEVKPDMRGMPKVKWL